MVDMPPAPTEQQPQGINLKAYLPVIATVYAEGAGKNADFKRQIASTILNRTESGKPEFGADAGNITDVLQKGYYSYSKQSPKYKEAISQKFSDKPSEDSFKETVRVFAGLLNGDIPRSDAQFFFNKGEMSRLSKQGSGFNMKALEPVDQQGDFTFLKYKDSPTPKAGRKK